MEEYFIEDFDGTELICYGDAQDCMSLEGVVERLNEYVQKIEKYEAKLETPKEVKEEQTPHIFIKTYQHKTMNGLIQSLSACEFDLQNKKHNLEQKKIKLWFNEDGATRLGKAKPSEKDKDKAVTDILKTQIFEVKQLEIEFNLLKREYETALRYSYDILK